MTDWVKENWEWIGLLAQILFGWLIWSMRKEFATRADLLAIGTRVTATETELKLHQQTLEALPTDGDLHAIQDQLAEVHRQSSVTAKSVDGMSDQVKALARQVGQLNTFLLENSRPRT
jgi:hypothetical protein